jgi:hypothetical protein
VRRQRMVRLDVLVGDGAARGDEVPADPAANPRAVVGEDAVLTGEPAWTALDDHQLDRFLKDSSP